MKADVQTREKLCVDMWTCEATCTATPADHWKFYFQKINQS